jgi:coatomer subunit beta'
VYWSDPAGTSLVLALEETFYLLQYNADTVEAALARPGTDESEDGYEEAFTFVEEFHETVSSGCWISNECFVFTTPKGSINYLLTGGQGSPRILKLSNSDKKYFILGYDPKQQGGRLYLIDKSLNIVSFNLQLALVNFQAAILSEDIHGAQAFFKEVPESQHSKLAKFLEANNQKEMAFAVTPDKDHKFELALGLNKVEDAFGIAEE